MTPWRIRTRRSDPEGLKVGPGVVIPISPRDGRERVLWALSGVSMELAALDWAWNPTRTPRETKLMIRDQLRENDRRWAYLEAKHKYLAPHPTLLGKPRA
jgi:hypothetical protein